MYFPLQNTCARVLSTMEGGLAIYRLAGPVPGSRRGRTTSAVYGP